jgi:glutathione S-transferase
MPGMRLIGMMDSPYVRRVAASLRLMDLPFQREAVSVFRQYDTFAAINPAVKAPTLVTDDGVVLMDSTLILQYLEPLAAPERRLTPTSAADQARSLSLIGFALAACEKAVQIVYEQNLRPPERQHEPWLERVQGQMLAALGVLEAKAGFAGAWLFADRPLQADITLAVTWRFTQHAVADRVTPAAFPALAALSARAEALPAFAACPLE